MSEGCIGDAYFKLNIPWTKFVLSNSITLEALACRVCGNVMLQVNPTDIQSILGANSTDRE